MPTAALPRRLLVMTGLALYAGVFAVFVFFEVPGLGLGHFFYLPVALLAIVGGMRVGLAAGATATALYALAILATPRIPSGDVLTAATAIRLITYSSCGVLVGWFAGEHRRHADQLRELAERDFLTSLLNTRVFDDALSRRCTAAQPFVLLLGDMDNLKEINDAHGHVEGNRVLRRLADALRDQTTGQDELARVGGDEFAVLTDASVDEAPTLCSRLQRILGKHDLHITFGWAAFPNDGTAPLELFRKADDRLYAAKLVSRNRRTVVALEARR